MPIDTPWFLPIAAVAVLSTGISKSGIGGGIGGLAVPLLALIMAPAQAAAIMLPILCLMDLFAVRAYWRRWDGRHLRRLLPAALLGIGAGAAGFHALDADALRLLLGVISVSFCLDAWRRVLRRQPAKRRPAAFAGVVCGAAAGFTSTIAHAGGPPLSMYLIPQRLERGLFVGTSALFFLVVNYVKLIPYAFLGLLQPANLGYSLMLAPLAPAGIWLGLAVHRRLSERVFHHLVHGVLFATGLKLIWDGLAAAPA